MATTIAQAYVQIMPSTKGIGNDLSSQLNGELSSAGESGGKSWTSGFKSAATGAAKTIATGLGVAKTAAAALTKSVVSSYADYEQFVGGVETLFGDSAGKVISDASNAFKTAGMSANDYMNTTITSAAAMINSLGGDTEKAADMMNMSITDMSDNVNKMGTNMQSVQDAYRGFSRGNFTMLDNLALGFAGTKEGMQELLDKAEELSGVKFDISSYSDIVQAIHTVQEEMGITGTTAKEASETIAGSVGAMKSAWQNLVTGLADGNADISGLVNNLITTLVGEGGEGGVINNILPAVQQALDGIIQLITTAVPQIIPIIVDLITTNLPNLVKAGMEILKSVAQGIVDALPDLLQAGVEIISTVADGIIDALPELIPALVEVTLLIVEKLTDPDMLAKMLEAGIKILLAVGEGLIKAIPKLVEHVPKIIGNLIQVILEFLPQLLESGVKLIEELAKGVVEGAGAVITAIGNMMKKVKDAIKEKIEQAKQWGADLIQKFIDGIKSKLSGLWNTVSGIAEKIKGFLGFSEPKEGPLSNFHTYAPDMMKLFAQGIRENEHLITDQIGRSFSFGGAITAGAAVGAVGGTTNYNITVNGIEELEEMLRWFESRQIVARMA